MNMLGNFGAALFPMAVPMLLRIGVPEGQSNWNLVLLTFAAMFAGAALCWLLADGKATVDPGGRSANGDGRNDEKPPART
jgi:nitrate/nitrite transporter NarK